MFFRILIDIVHRLDKNYLHTLTAITCPSLSPGSAQMISYTPDTTAPFSHGTTASFFCADGSYLDGVQTRLCSGDGTSTSGLWSGIMPICRGT